MDTGHKSASGAFGTKATSAPLLDTKQKVASGAVTCNATGAQFLDAKQEVASDECDECDEYETKTLETRKISSYSIPPSSTKATGVQNNFEIFRDIPRALNEQERCLINLMTEILKTPPSDDSPNSFIRMMKEDWRHYTHQYQLGLNVDSVKFNPMGSCGKGGLYFTLRKYYNLYEEVGPFIAEVEIPDGAKVYVDPCGMKYKADKLIIKKVWYKYDYPYYNKLLAGMDNLRCAHSRLLFKFHHVLEICSRKIVNPFTGKRYESTAEEAYDDLVSKGFIVPFDDLDYIKIYNIIYSSRFLSAAPEKFDEVFIRPSDVFLSYVACRRPELLTGMKNLNPLVRKLADGSM